MPRLTTDINATPPVADNFTDPPLVHLPAMEYEEDPVISTEAEGPIATPTEMDATEDVALMFKMEVSATEMVPIPPTTLFSTFTVADPRLFRIP